jgi:hypothetical protein
MKCPARAGQARDEHSYQIEGGTVCVWCGDRSADRKAAERITLTVRADCARCNGRGWRCVRVLTETGGIAPMPETIRALCECVRAE